METWAGRRHRWDEGTGRMEAQAGRGTLYLLEQGRIAAFEAAPGVRDGEQSRELGRYSTPFGRTSSQPLTTSHPTCWHTGTPGC